MTLKEREVQGVVVLELSGKIMGGPEASEFQHRLHALVDEGKTKVIADLSDVNWMNSSGLGILIGGLTTLKSSGGDLKLVGASGKIESLLIITKLIKIFDSFNSLEEAVASFS